jgi:hypothetical protein
MSDTPKLKPLNESSAMPNVQQSSKPKPPIKK